MHTDRAVQGYCRGRVTRGMSVSVLTADIESAIARYEALLREEVNARFVGPLLVGWGLDAQGVQNGIDNIQRTQTAGSEGRQAARF